MNFIKLLQVQQFTRTYSAHASSSKQYMWSHYSRVLFNCLCCGGGQL